MRNFCGNYAVISAAYFLVRGLTKFSKAPREVLLGLLHAFTDENSKITPLFDENSTFLR